ncbi:SPRY domain-containing SOCS box protein 3 [Elysia marginata]|uniref:SPRY domain-containing SOCS box protein 3 n=1 Tax=Elysia marginata TaxID=1093978 RepID=A0AAV4JIS1_9GAST|nr:SPRY domain-containing SOCS box protein 3 [Elysia marginata]
MNSSSDTLKGVSAQGLEFCNRHSLPYVSQSSRLHSSKTFSHQYHDKCLQQNTASLQSKELGQTKMNNHSGIETSFETSQCRKSFRHSGINTESTQGEKKKCKYCLIRMAKLRQLEKKKNTKSSRRRTLSSGISSSKVSGHLQVDRGCQTSAALFEQAPMTQREIRCFISVLRYPNEKPLRTETFCSCVMLGREDDCTCGEIDSSFEWLWDRNNRGDTAFVQQDARVVIFHKDYSCGTAAICGEQVMDKDQYFWEVKMTTPVYGTDMMLGVGTTGVDLNGHHNEFCSMLGTDGDSWGFSYDGRVQHNGKKRDYSGRYGQGAIIGVHLDMWHGTLTFFKNRINLGIAYKGLRGKSLYPMACSTAARSAMRIVSSRSFPSSLQYLCCRLLRKLVPLKLNVLDVVPMPPGLRLILGRNLGWLLQAPPVPAQGQSSQAPSNGYVCNICLPMKNVFEGYTDDEGEISDEDHIHNGFNFLDSDDEDDSEESGEEEASRSDSRSPLKRQTALVETFARTVFSSLSDLPLHPSSSSGNWAKIKRRRLDLSQNDSSSEEDENSESEDGILKEDGDTLFFERRESSEEDLPRKSKLRKRKRMQW